MAEERTPIVEEKFEDYSLEQLEVKKRITEEKIKERIEYSIPYRIQKRFGIDVYRLARYLIVIEVIIFVIGMIYFMGPLMMNPPSAENPQDVSEYMNPFMIFFVIMLFTMMPTFMVIGNDPTTSLRRKLREINRAIRIKQEVAQGDSFDLVDESEKREYKSSFKYDYNTKSANNSLSKFVVQSVLGFLNCGGGILVIGVDDDKNVLGVDKDLQFFKGSWDKYQLAIQDSIRKHTDSPLTDFIRVERIEKDGKQLCTIMTKPSPKPVYYIDGDKQDLYVRDGNSTIKLSTKRALDYLTSHWIDKNK